MTRFWHPVADMHAVSSAGELVLDRAVTGRAVLAARARGVLTRGLVGGGLQVSPALVIDDASLGALDDLAAS